MNAILKCLRNLRENTSKFNLTIPSKIYKQMSDIDIYRIGKLNT